MLMYLSKISLIKSQNSIQLIRSNGSYKMRYSRSNLKKIRKCYCSQNSQFIGLPFKISIEEANKILINNRKILEKNHNDNTKKLIPYDNTSMVKEYFIPFHSADISNVTSSFKGKYGKDRIEYYISYEYCPSTKITIPKIKTRIVTDWYDASDRLGQKNYPIGTYDTQIYAGFEFPRKEIESVLVSDDIISVIPLNDDMLVNYKRDRIIVHPHDMSISFAIEKMINKLHKCEVFRAKKMLLKKYNADHADIENLIIHLENADIKLLSYHLPVYVYTYTCIHDKICMYKFVNGYSGRYDGEYILSSMKLFLIGSIIGASIVPLFVTGTISTILLVGRMILGSLLTGIPAALYAKYRHIFKKKSDKSDRNEYLSYNDTFQETDDDIKRKTNAENFNQQNKKYHINVNDDEIKEKLVLIGLNPEVLPSEELLKQHYHDYIKKWHPDVYNGDKNIAKAMTQQINEAYHILLHAIKIAKH